MGEREAIRRGNLTKVESAPGCFLRNVPRMQYGAFRAKYYLIGWGVIEAGCRSIIAKRCKQSGMFWSQTGAETVPAFRCIHAGIQFDPFW